MPSSVGILVPGTWPPICEQDGHGAGSGGGGDGGEKSAKINI